MRHVTRKDYLKFMSTLLSAVMIVVALPWNVFVINAATTDHPNVATVTVTDTAGNKVQGATVNIKLEDWNKNYTATSGNDGVAILSTYNDEIDSYPADKDITFSIEPPENSGYIAGDAETIRKADLPKNGNKDVTLSIKQLQPGIDFTIDDCDVSYDGQSHSINVDIESSWGTTVYYSLDNSNWTESKPVFTDVIDSKTVYVKVEGNGYYGTGSGTVTITEGTLDDLTFTVGPEVIERIFHEEMEFDNPVRSDKYDLSGLTINYSSTNTAVARVSSTGTVRYGFTPGDTTIYATVSGPNFETKTISYDLHVRLPRDDFEFVTDNMVIRYGDLVDNHLSHTYEDDVVYYEITHQERDGVEVNNVATIDHNTGKVTVLTAGTITVHATVTSGSHASGEASYTLGIERAHRDNVAFNTACPTRLEYNKSYSFSKFSINKIEDTDNVVYSVSSGSQYLTVEGNSFKVIEVSEDTEDVVKIKATITNDCYEDVIELVVVTVRAKMPNLAFNDSVYYATYSYDNNSQYYPQLKNNLSTGRVKYTLSGNDHEVNWYLITTTEYYALVAGANNNYPGYIEFSGKGFNKPSPSVRMTLTATVAQDNHYEGSTCTMTLVFRQDDSLADRITVEGTMGSGGWYTSDTVTITPNDGYAIDIINEDSLENVVWHEDAIVLTEEQTSTYDYSYLCVKNLSNENVAIEPISDQDKFGNADRIKIDGSDPYNLTIKYEQPILKTIINAITFGFYNTTTTVVVSATDDRSGIDKFVYALYDGNNAGALTDALCDPFDMDDEGNVIYSDTRTAKITIDPEFRGQILIQACDNAGRTTNSHVNANNHWVLDPNIPVTVGDDAVDDYSVVLDSVKPKIEVQFDNNNASNGYFYNKVRNAEITINEANFDNPQDVVVNVFKYSDDDNTSEESVVNKNADGRLFNGTHQATVHFGEGAYRLVINYTDLSTNTAVKYDSGLFVIDLQKPKVSLSFDKSYYSTLNNVDYYCVNPSVEPLITATLTIEDSNFDCTRDLTVNTFYAVDADNSSVTISTQNKTEDGVPVNVSYSQYLRTKANWKHSGNIHTCKFTLTKEALYKMKLTVDDGANNEDVVFEKNFCLDGTAPTDLKIEYGQTPLKALINTLTLGLFFNDKVTVTISSVDSTSQIQRYDYSYTVDADASSINVGGSRSVDRSNSILQVSGSYSSVSFDIPAQFRGQIGFTAYDLCGNSSSAFNGSETYEGSKYPTTIIVDNIAPEVNVAFDNNDVRNDKYFNSLRTVTITVDEANFFEELMVITITKDGTPITIPYSFDPVAGEEDKYQAIITFEDDGDYTFDISGSDYSGNQAIVTYDEGTKAANDFVIDTTAPVVTVAFDNEDVHGTHYFNRERTVTVTFVEHNFDADESHLLVNSAQVNPPAVEWTHDGDTYKAVYKFESEGQYTFDIECQDKAENEFVYSSTSANADWDRLFVIDMSAPTDLTIMINDTDDVLGDYSGIETETIIPREDSNIRRRNIATRNDVVFDKFYMNTITIKLNADFSIAPMPDDGTGRLEYQMVDKLSDYSVDGTWTTYVPAVGITVNPTQKFILFVRATDLADNETIVNSTGIIVDNHEPEGERHAPNININPSAPNANGFYNHNVDVSLTVVDPAYIGDSRNENGYYSGINKVICNVHADDIGESETQVLYDRDAGTNEGSITEQVDNLVHVWTDSITINANRFNSNNVIVEITSYDNAGNKRITSTALGDIKIDVTNPTIEVSYNNNSADLDNCFKADRVATIVITERNFNGADVRAAITSSNGRIPEVNGWTKTAGTGNGDNTKWTATVTYNTDGDYTFDIAYTDLADNAAGAANYGSSVAPTSFTIDKTLPTVNVTYDNNDAEHDMYYKAPRTATIVINEHNFIANRVNITVTATDDGANIAAPTISGWSNVGDRHTATITYDRDGRYTFDISVRDKAGNDSANYADDLFVVDTTAPSLTISGVKNNSANSGSVAPVLTYSDTNFDKSLVDISLVGANRGNVTLNGSYSEIHNGNIFNFNNFANTKENDDIYTLSVTITDLAGNVSTQEITFSVNRFGSTYRLSEETEAIRGQYLQEPVDVVVTEVNANELSDIRITVFKNNDTIVLTEGVDYDVNVTGGNGQWYEYEYVIHSRNFNDDGVYRVVIHSQDSAGNISENTLDTKDESTIQFGIDKIKPNIVVSNLEKNTTYAFEQYTVRMSISDNLLLSSVEVYLDGKLLDPATWDAEQIAAIIAENGEFTFNVDSANHARNVKIVAKDAAGNIQEIEIDNFYVTTNMFIRFFTNTPLFVGSIIGIILLIALIIFIVVTKRKKKTR